ncbi:Calmodulin-regulated spectrin-associated protein 1 [Galemys pyrenaicus]|uniref:Calmodulin-regulated spectrin-associated protein 1 n=1 Tax=Galemys pyrenaicus TaxID=202257 RepID=A0A8J6DR10_GALPY|nr:Calmodulin-regulated spectrin-associated protein 1 [Galemys pyrenaicus]
MEALPDGAADVVPPDRYDAARAKIAANLQWTCAKAYGRGGRAACGRPGPSVGGGAWAPRVGGRGPDGAARATSAPSGCPCAAFVLAPGRRAGAAARSWRRAGGRRAAGGRSAPLPRGRAAASPRPGPSAGRPWGAQLPGSSFRAGPAALSMVRCRLAPARFGPSEPWEGRGPTGSWQRLPGPPRTLARLRYWALCSAAGLQALLERGSLGPAKRGQLLQWLLDLAALAARPGGTWSPWACALGAARCWGTLPGRVRARPPPAQARLERVDARSSAPARAGWAHLPAPGGVSSAERPAVWCQEGGLSCGCLGVQPPVSPWASPVAVPSGARPCSLGLRLEAASRVGGEGSQGGPLSATYRAAKSSHPAAPSGSGHLQSPGLWSGSLLLRACLWGLAAPGPWSAVLGSGRPGLRHRGCCG